MFLRVDFNKYDSSGMDNFEDYYGSSGDYYGSSGMEDFDDYYGSSGDYYGSSGMEDYGDYYNRMCDRLIVVTKK